MQRDEFLLLASLTREYCEEEMRRQSAFEFWRQKDLSFMCAYASTLLFGVLQHHEIKSVQLHCSDWHAFLKVGRKILDITATQFSTEAHNFDPVVFLPLPELQKQAMKSSDRPLGLILNWKANQSAQSLDEIFDLLNPSAKTGFPDGQFWSCKEDMLKAVDEAIKFVSRKISKKVPDDIIQFRPIEKTIWADTLEDEWQISAFIASITPYDVDESQIEDFYFNSHAILDRVPVKDLQEGDADSNLLCPEKQEAYRALPAASRPPIMLGFNNEVMDGNHRLRDVINKGETYILAYRPVEGRLRKIRARRP